MALPAGSWRHHEITRLSINAVDWTGRLAGSPGGNGVAFDWSLLNGGGDEPFILSGGLTLGNVAEAIRVTRAPIVDVSSGVETVPGVKDVTLIRKFVEAAKSAR